MRIYLLFLTQYIKVTNAQTDRQTDTTPHDGIHSIARQNKPTWTNLRQNVVLLFAYESFNHSFISQICTSTTSDVNFGVRGLCLINLFSLFNYLCMLDVAISYSS